MCHRQPVPWFVWSHSFVPWQCPLEFIYLFTQSIWYCSWSVWLMICKYSFGCWMLINGNASDFSLLVTLKSRIPFISSIWEMFYMLCHLISEAEYWTDLVPSAYDCPSHQMYFRHVDVCMHRLVLVSFWSYDKCTTLAIDLHRFGFGLFFSVGPV